MLYTIQNNTRQKYYDDVLYATLLIIAVYCQCPGTARAASRGEYASAPPGLAAGAAELQVASANLDSESEPTAAADSEY